MTEMIKCDTLTTVSSMGEVFNVNYDIFIIAMVRFTV